VRRGEESESGTAVDEGVEGVKAGSRRLEILSPVLPTFILNLWCFGAVEVRALVGNWRA
jgi:hypothetical protein